MTTAETISGVVEARNERGIRVAGESHVLELFWSHVLKSDGCWLWQGARDRKGYGRLNRRIYGDGRAARVSYRIHHGRIPDGYWVLHNCDNPPCVRPDHLFTAPPLVNTQLMMVRGRHYSRTRPESILRGERVGTSKLTSAEVDAIRARLVQGHRQTDIAADFGVGKSAIWGIAHGRSWRRP